MSINKVLLLGSGGLRIGQAGEFDYSGSQAIKALKQESIYVVLVNPNIATVQTDANMADKVYLQPLTVDVLTQIIKKEKPDAILLSFGGQTALNLGLALEEAGVLEKYQVKILGSSATTIRLAEDRDLFKAELMKIDIKTPVSIAAASVDAAVAAAEKIGYPIMLRSAFSLGGLGSGRIDNETDLKARVNAVLNSSPQVLIEEYLIGWSEFEYEIVRDRAGNTITVCNMENFDPMGIHTGDSIVISPSQSLNNEQYHFLRDISRRVANHFEIIGECNIQFAYHLPTGDYRVIEINPRLSRSSALASKATGYPLAYVATKLALGANLYELKNEVTQSTCAFFEPALDYVVVKIPRWDTNKFRQADRTIGTEMKSVGEVMAIGRSFPESLQKAIGMLNIGILDIDDCRDTFTDLSAAISKATDKRLFALYQFFKQGGRVDTAHELSGVDTWFLAHLHTMAQFAVNQENADELSRDNLRTAKQLGFSDFTIGKWFNQSADDIRAKRKQHDITPVVKQIDTLAGEFAAQTNYLYMTYHGSEHDINPSVKPATIILGSGPYSIGSSVEFDWCAVNTARTLRTHEASPIIINSNPETVSTDYDESDRLYFEQLSLERVSDIAEFENLGGIIVSVGGQIANNLALPLKQAGFPILGTSPDDIARAEDREQFSSLLNKLDIDQPAWMAANDLDSAKAFAEQVGYPVLLRPSFVLSGAAMNVVYDDEQLSMYLAQATEVSRDHPVVVSQFISEAKELEIDGVAEKGQVVIQAISEHVENAGVHSGDATIVLPPQRLYLETIRRAKRITKQIIQALNISGPFNIQFIAKDNELKVIECNVRASRSFPFVSKTTGHNFIAIAAEVLINQYKPRRYETLELDYVGVKTAQFSYSRLKGANPVAHVEMASTGEVACLGDDLLDAFYRSWQASDLVIRGKRLFVSVGDRKSKVLDSLRALEQQGWTLITTEGTHEFLYKRGIASRCVFKTSTGMTPNVTSLLAEHAVDLIINIPSGRYDAKQSSDGFIIRRMAIDHNIPLVTNLQCAQALLQCLVQGDFGSREVKAWQEYVIDADD